MRNLMTFPRNHFTFQMNIHKVYSLIALCFVNLQSLAAIVCGNIDCDTDVAPVCAIYADGAIVSEANADSHGDFSIDCECVGKAKLLIDASGFERYEKDIDIPAEGKLDVGVCKLTRMETLDELVVEASSVQSKNGKLIFAPTKGALAGSTYAPEFLSHLGIPGLSYDAMNQVVKVDNGAPLILIDGVKATEKTLQHLRAENIANVEYSRVLPLIYYGQGTAMINILLKERLDGGFLNVMASVDVTGTMVDPQATFEYHKGASSFTISPSFSYRNNDRTFDTITEDYTAQEQQFAHHSSLITNH